MRRAIAAGVVGLARILAGGAAHLLRHFAHPTGRFRALARLLARRRLPRELLGALPQLQLIPRDYFEAADLFGANRLRRTVHVVLPLLRPSLQSALIIRTIFAFQTFAVVFALAGRNMPVLAGEAYTWYATNRNEHVAAAYAVLLLGLTIVATVVYLRVLGLREAEVQR